MSATVLPPEPPRTEPAADSPSRLEPFRPQVVAYLDILGYRQLVGQAVASPERAQEIIGLLERAIPVAQDAADMGLAGSPQEPFRTGSKIISDSIILVSDCIHSSPGTVADAVFSLLLGLTHIQGELALPGILVRGAVSAGMHYENDKVVFSEALTNAVSLEQQAARYPRIIIDRDVIMMLRLSSHPADTEYIEEFFRKDADGYYIVDYLQFYRELDDRESQELFFRRHAEVLRGKLAAESDPHIIEKLQWLARYHNWKVEGILGRMPADMRVDNGSTVAGPGILEGKQYLVALLDDNGVAREMVNVTANSWPEAFSQAKRGTPRLQPDLAGAWDLGELPEDLLLRCLDGNGLSAAEYRVLG